MIDTMFFSSSVKDDLNLADVAADVFRALGITQTEERQSANYPPDEHYFAGYAQNACVQICDSDNDKTPDFPFLISVEEPRSWRSGVGTIETDPQRMARLLVAGGFRVFIPHGAWYLAGWDGDGDVYEG